MTDIIKLQSQDNQLFELSIKAATMSETVKNLLEDVDTADAIPLPNVTGKILAKVVEYVKHHAENPIVPNETDGINPWDMEFCKVDQPTLFELILAANYLDIKSLLDLSCKTVANMIKGKTPEEIRKTFNIKNDFTPEEEDQVRKENELCEEL